MLRWWFVWLINTWMTPIWIIFAYAFVWCVDSYCSCMWTPANIVHIWTAWHRCGWIYAGWGDRRWENPARSPRNRRHISSSPHFDSLSLMSGQLTFVQRHRFWRVQPHVVWPHVVCECCFFRTICRSQADGTEIERLIEYRHFSLHSC